MRASVLGIGICLCVAASDGQTLDLRGRVVQGNGLPVPDAWVELKHRGTSARTGADGSFALDGNSGTIPAFGRSSYRLDPHFLFVEAHLPLDLRMEVIDGAGRRLGACDRRLEKGRHRLALAEAMRVPGPDAGLYFLGLHLGGEIRIHPFFHPGGGSRGSIFAPAYRGSPAAKRTALVDSLRIRKAGYQDLAVPVTSYTAGALGDLILSPSPHDGSICARQRLQRTSDGFDVVFCEALFDPPTRVRLPAATAISALAALTSDAFVTEAGQSYPHTIRNSTDPEVKRHASALYELKLQDGKVESFRPAVLFAESLFLAPLMGKAFEGLISKRTASNRYELTPTLPIRLQVLTELSPGDASGASAFQVRAIMVNQSASVTASDGSCMPGLAGYGSQAPFAPGSEITFMVGRVPSMHTFGDNELVFTLSAGSPLGSLMSRQWFFTPLDILKDALAPTGTYAGVGHGSPGTIPMLTLNPASGGGAACSPK